MAGFGKYILNNIVKESIFEKIGRYIFICCERMKDDLLDSKRMLPNDENKIRNFLLEKYLDNNSCRREHNMMMYHFDSELSVNFIEEDLRYKGRVDIRIVSQNDWFEDRNAVYFVECKRLDGKKHLNKEYVLNGIKRFVVKPALYSSYFGSNYMLGFLVSDIDIASSIKEINTFQEADSEINNTSDLNLVSIGDYEVYTCKYGTDDDTIELMHMFTDLSDTIEKNN